MPTHFLRLQAGWASVLSALCAIAALLAAPNAQAQTAAPVLDQTEYASCLNQLRGTAAFGRISDDTWQRFVAPLQADGSVLPLLNAQPEFTMPVWDYMAVLVDDERVSDGRAALKQWLPTLQQVQSRYGVAPAMVLGVWGVESNFGKNLGARPLLVSLGTLSCFGRRQSYFRSEFANALRIVQEGHIPAEKLSGSWAGAFGQTQFMPSTFFRTAVDFDGDGRRDIVDSVPDALASTARFLQQAGYVPGQPWGYEVRLNQGEPDVSGRRSKKPLSYWRSAGVTLPDGSPLPDTLTSAGLLLPAGASGPAFLVGKNFDTLYSYNASENYALAIAHLSDLIANPAARVPFARAWPTDDPGLSRAQNRQLQALLIAKGYDIGTPDGLIGAKTRTAIRAEQQRLGMAVNGRAGQKLLAALQ
ncbi:lytic murein transglycosylase [Amphibiibacter pelophylacis]|uniref:Lytic murein transglycosylase n=1 Tax=Amphibiibacter pelophylacis TaxID=1799477 RepID=A0ACC6P224_9BURK